MSSNLVFQIKSDEEFLKFKSEIGSLFSLQSVETKETFIKERFIAITSDGKITFILYKNGKFLIQGSPDSESFNIVNEKAKELLAHAIKHKLEEKIIDLTSVDKNYFIGLDESGAGETFGSLFLGIAIITKENLLKAQEIIQPTDVKEFDIDSVLGLHIKSKKFFARELKRFVAREIDSSNKIYLLDQGYIELLSKHKDILPDSCIILDNYGIGPELKKFLKEWEAKGMKVILSHRADSTYLPPMAASIIARKARNKEIETISMYNNLIDPETREKIPFTQGSPSNSLTEKWLVTYRKINPYADFPAFVRSKWKNVKDIEAKFPKKKISYTFSCVNCKSNFGKLFIKFNKIKQNTELLCSDCGQLVTKEHFKEHFKTSTVVMDTSSLINRIVSKDLKTTKYLEGMKILIPSCIYEEIDSKQPDKKRGAENEISALKEFQNKGLIDFQDVDVDSLTGLSNDKKIIHIVREHGASLITYDRTQNLWSTIGSFVFVIIDN